jgi:copper resistance protein D
MSEAIIALRFIQFGGAAILFGSALFFLYGPLLKQIEAPHWTRRLLIWAASALIVATLLNFVLQLVGLAGSIPAAMEPSAWHTALLEMNFGKSSIFRFAFALLALWAIFSVPAGRRLWWICAGLGAATCASFAWMGHGAATEGMGGWIHLGADIMHCLAAAGWIGALVVFCLALRLNPLPNISRLHAALAAFSGVGSVFVAATILTGLVNTGFLVGWDLVRALSTPYGDVLAAKLALFGLMLALAAANRYRHAPALAGTLASPALALINLRRSIGLETVAAFGVLALVSWLGTLPPVR